MIYHPLGDPTKEIKAHEQERYDKLCREFLAGFSKSLANEVYQENIRVHLISPGGVYTPMDAQTRPDLTPDMVSLPEDIANIAAFYLQMRDANEIVDEIQVHRSGKEPFS